MPLFKRCCYVCKADGCATGAKIPLANKEIVFESSGCNPLSESPTIGTFSRTGSGCCSEATLPMTANYVSPTFSGSSVFSDGGNHPLHYCCGTTEYILGHKYYESRLAYWFNYRFRLRLCNLKITVCQKVYPYGVCGIEVKAKAIYGWKMVGSADQYCQARIRTVQDYFITSCNPATGTVATTSAGTDTTVMLNRCCSTSIVLGCSGDTEFASVPEPVALDAPAPFECNYGLSFLGLYTDLGGGGSYFHLERTLFIPGATAIPETPLSFTAAGQSLVGSAGYVSFPTIYSSQPTYGAGTETLISTNACGRGVYSTNYMNGLLYRNDGFCRCDPTDGSQIVDRARSETHTRSIAPGGCFFDPTLDPWEITIRDPV